MDAIIRSIAIFGFLLLVLRLGGKRTMADISTFDFILLLIIGESTQQALLGDDFSFTNAALVITTLISLDIGISLVKQRFKKVESWLDGKPLIIAENGKLIKSRAQKERVDEADIMEAARRLQGLERLSQVKYAILEQSGGITIIPQTSKE